jgi:insulysin
VFIDTIEGDLGLRYPAPTLPESERVSPRSLSLPRGSNLVYSKKNITGAVANSAVFNYYQFGHLNIHEYLVLELLHNILFQKAFTQLRTNEQLGYIVSTGHRPYLGSDGFVVVVQSAVASPNYLDSRIEAFFTDIWHKVLL